MKLILQKFSKLHFSFSLDRSAVICLETLAYCWISAVEKACLWFNPKRFPSPSSLAIYSPQHKIITLTLCEWIPMQVTPFPTEWVPWHWSCPGNLSKLLHLGLHTFTMSNIAIKPVVSFSPGLHSDRFEATSSVMLLLVFLPMCSYGHMEPPPEVFLASPVCRSLAGSVFPSWWIIENQCQIVPWHQTSECKACIQNWEVSLWETGFSGIIWYSS